MNNSHDRRLEMRWLPLLLVSSVALAKPGAWSAVRDGVHTDVAASPDGAWVAYWTSDGVLNLFDTRAGRVIHTHLPDDFGGHLVWSHDHRVAFDSAAGLAIYDVATDTSRVVTTAIPNSTNYGFSMTNTLCWVEVKWLFCDGTKQPVATVHGRYHTFMHGEILSCDLHPADSNGGCTTLWITDLDTRKEIDLHPPSKIWQPYLAPTRDRVCFVGDGLHCIDLATRTDHLIDRITGFGHVGYPWSRPFSDDGTHLVWHSGKRIRVYDFGSDTAADATGDVGYQDAAFWGNDSMLLFENVESTSKSRKRVALAEVKLGSHTIEPIVLDDTEYTVPVLIAGRKDLLFAGRETAGSRVIAIVRR